MTVLSPWLISKEPACNTVDTGEVGSILGKGRSPGGRHDNSLQCSCLGNPMDRKAWWATVHGVAQSWTQRSTHTWRWLGPPLNENQIPYLPIKFYKQRGRTDHDSFAAYTDFVVLRSLNQFVCSSLPFSAEAASSPCMWARHHWAISKSHAVLVMDGWMLPHLQLHLFLCPFFTAMFFFYYHTWPEKGQVRNKQALKAGTQKPSIFWMN